MLLLNIIIGAFVFQYVQSVNIFSLRKNQRNVQPDAVRNFLDGLIHLLNSDHNGRRCESEEIMKKKYLVETLRSEVPEIKLKSLLRKDDPYIEFQLPPVQPKKDLISMVVEKELKQAVAKKTSALLDRPILEQKGRQDFLVINPGATDPFASVIPNDIYYNHEKSCVNWLEDCNAQGMRARLWQKIKSPFT